MIVADVFLILTLVLVLVAYRRARRGRDEALEDARREPWDGYGYTLPAPPDDPGGHVRNVRRFDR